ncbi:MAG: InlB B-repeat-containing protein [Clostridia bacterium]|nr:InlB B-repeat-containing protein [Clostridia bacterium]
MKTQFKKMTAWMLTLAMLFTMLPSFTLTAFAAESLTDSTTGVILADSDGDDYYEVDTPDKLVAFANLVNAGNDSINIELTNDIDMTGKEWSMIVYGGIINGNEHTVSNLTFVATEADGEQYAGLIYAYDATVKNITFEKCRTVINSTTSSERDIYAAIIAPVAIGGIFENCSLVDCTVTQSGIASGFSYAGSLAGLTAYGLKITDCSVENCTVTDDSESADGSFAGGLAGGFWADEAAYDFGVQVKNNTINADVTAKNSPGVDAASGLVCSVLDDSLAIVQVYDNCTVDGTIIADDVAAGLIGDCIGYDMTISNCTILCDSISATYGDPFAYGEWAQKGVHDYYTMTYSNLKISENTEFVCKQFENTLGKYYLSDLYADGAFDADIVSFADSAAEVSYTVTVSDSIENGTVKADVSKAAEGDTVTLTVTPDDGYVLDILTVKDADDNDVTVTDNTFTMPAKAVTVTATFKVKVNYPDGTIIIPLDTNGVPTSISGTGWTYDSGTNTLTLTNGYSYAVDGECEAIVNNSGTIVGGTYNNTVNNVGDGDTTWKEQFGIIDGGIFNGAVNNADGLDICTINDGTFNGTVTNKNRGVINNGTFLGEFTEILGSTINGGTFVVEFIANGGTWTTGYTVPTTYTYTDGLVLPTGENISNGTLSFDGWYDNAEFTGLPVTEIPAASSGKQTYYARFVDGIATWEAAGNLAVENTDYTVDADGNYTVLTAKGLAKIANIVNGVDSLAGKTVTLANDINLLDGGVYQYGADTVTERNSWISIDGFAGTFNGNGKKINGLYILTTNKDAGLFGSNVGTIKELEIASGKVTINVSSGSELHAGGIAATTSGLIDNCINRAEIYSNDTSGSGSVYIGGITGLVGTSTAGAAVSTVSDCTNYGTVSSLGNSNCGISGGGIAGYHFSGRITGRKTLITRCVNEGTISIEPGTGGWAGGIAGTVKSNSNSNTSITATVTNCANKGSVGSNMAGGITGYNTNAAYVYNCYNMGSITGNTNAGGIVGLNYYSNATVANCYSTGSVSNATNIGGIVGRIPSGSISNCYYLSSAATEAYGYKATAATMDNCAAFTTSGSTHTLASAVYETTDLLTALKEWVSEKNVSDYMDWKADAENSNYPVLTEYVVSVTYTITFDANGGTATPASAETETDGRLTELPTPTRTGYNFKGWFDAQTGGNAVTTDKVYTENTTIYAQWQRDTSVQLPIYIDGTDGNDENDGLADETPVKTLAKALELAGTNGTIIVMKAVWLSSDHTIENITIERYENNTTGDLFSVAGNANDITTITVKNATIDGKGITLDNTINTNEELFWLGAYASLVLEEGAKLVNNRSVAVYVATNAELIMNNGEISGNISPQGFAVVHVSGTFKMNGGSIKNNRNEFSFGGAVDVYDGTFIMTDGEISGNYACTGGGGVFGDGATLTILNGKIINNTVNNDATNRYGGGIYGCYDTTLNIYGGEISGNTCLNGDAISFMGNTNTTINVKGSPKISGTIDIGPASMSSAVQVIDIFTPVNPVIVNRWGATAGTAIATYADGLTADASEFASYSDAYVTGIDGQNVILANFYTVTFNDWDGSEIDSQTVTHGSAATAPTDPTRTGYTFTGWDKAFNNVTSNLTVTAQYTINTYTVTFNDHDGSEIDSQTVNHGSAATAPTDPTREGYTFTGWDKAFDNVTSNLTVTAQYVEKANVSITETAQTYTYGGTEKAFAISGTSLTGFTVEYYVEDDWTTDAPTDAGKYDVRITRDEDGTYKEFEKEITGGLVINPMPISGATVGTFAAMTYDGTEQTPTATVTIDGLTVTGTWSKVTNVADKTTFTADGNFTGTIADKETGMLKANSSVSTVPGANTLTYSEAAQELVTAGAANGGTIKYSLDNATWNDAIPTATNADTYEVWYKVFGDANHNDTDAVKVDVTIAKKSIEAATVALDGALTYTGAEQTQNVTVTLDGFTVTFDVTDNKATSVKTDGNYTLKVTANGNFEGEKTLEWNIAKATPAPNAEKVTTARVRRGQKLANATVTNGEFFAVDGTTVLEGTFAWVDNTKEITADSTEKMKFTPVDTNYAEIEIDVAVDSYTTGGGGGSSNTTTTTTKNDDGSTTKTTTNKATGTTTEVTTNTDGSTTTVETNKDGTVTTTEKDKDGNTTTTVENPDGTSTTTEKNKDGSETVVEKDTDGTTTTTEKDSEGNKTVTTEKADGTTTTEETKKDGTKVTTETNADGETTAEVEAKDETEVVIPVPDADEVTKVVVTDKDGNETEVEFEVKDGGIAISVSGNSTVSVQSGHTCYAKDFTDVDLNAWYHLNVDYVLENGLFKGTTETTFAPNGIITRAMMVTVLYRAEGEPTVTGTTTFEDVDSNAYYAKAVVWGQQNGIIKGYSETEFAPDQNITREQIAAIMHRYAQYKEYDVSVGENTNILSYDDYDSISEYAIASMQYAVGSGLIKGKSESTLNPLDNATRAEIAAILNRFIEANK